MLGWRGEKMAADVPVRQGREWSLVSDGILWECIGVRDLMAIWIKERVDMEGRKRKGSHHTQGPEFNLL